MKMEYIRSLGLAAHSGLQAVIVLHKHGTGDLVTWNPGSTGIIMIKIWDFLFVALKIKRIKISKILMNH